MCMLRRRTYRVKVEADVGEERGAEERHGRDDKRADDEDRVRPREHTHQDLGPDVCYDGMVKFQQFCQVL